MAAPLPQILIPCSAAFTAYAAGAFIASRTPWTAGRIVTLAAGATFFVWMYPWIDAVQGMGLGSETTNVALLGALVFGGPSVVMGVLLLWATRSWVVFGAPIAGVAAASVALLLIRAENPLAAPVAGAGLWHVLVAAALMRWAEAMRTGRPQRIGPGG